MSFTGVGSAGVNAWNGNWGAAAVDAGGVFVDVAATVLPGVPGGAAAGIKAGREGAKAVNAAGKGVGDAKSGAKSAGADFVVTSKGEAISVPDGAVGPNPTINKSGNEAGFEFTDGSGGKGMNSRVDGVRIMDANQNQGRRVNYMNSSRQTVDPTSGKTISKSDARGHTPVQEEK